MSATWNPRLVKTPVPMMFAITIPQAVKKPTVRDGGGNSDAAGSADFVILRTTITPGRQNS
jgi:hypothetical protein